MESGLGKVSGYDAERFKLESESLSNSNVLQVLKRTFDPFFYRSIAANMLREMSYVHDSTISWGPPKIWEIELSSYCPGQCVMCPKLYDFKRSPNHMDLGLFQKIISQIEPWYQPERPGGKPTIRLFHYGEPCLHPDFHKAIRICKRRGLRVTVSDIAALFSPGCAKDAIEAGLDDVWLMLDGMDDATCLSIRGKAASFEKGVSNIRALLDLKREMGTSHPTVNVTMIRQPANSHQWADFLDFWRNIEGVNARVAFFSSFGGQIEKINEMLKQLQSTNAQPEEDERVRKLNGYRCYYPWQSMSVLSDGRVVPCCRDMNGEYVLGDLRSESLAEIWNGNQMRELRSEWLGGKISNPLCNSCNEANNEIGLPNRHYPLFRVLDTLKPQRFSRPGGMDIK